MGIAVTALEPSPGMFREASLVTSGRSVALHRAPIEEYREGKFDSVLTHMCAQAVERLGEFITACAERLSVNGTLICAVPHPCFYNSYKRLIPDDQYLYAREAAASVSFSITAEPTVRFEGVPYHHRPLSSYVRAFAKAGLCMCQFLEPWPSPEVQRLYGEPWQTPRYCVFVCETGSRVDSRGVPVARRQG